MNFALRNCEAKFQSLENCYPVKLIGADPHGCFYAQDQFGSSRDEMMEKSLGIGSA